MRRGFLTLAAAAALSLSALTVPAAAARAVPVQVDGAAVATGRLDAGVTYAPLRTLLDALDSGWSVWWDSADGEAEARSADFSLTADPAADTLTVNGTDYAGRVYVENGRTYVPLRLTATLLGCGVAWDPYLGGAAVTSAGAAHDAVELYWLSRIISAESRGEPMAGQLAVGGVVLNRVASPDFPGTIPAVIFDRTDGVQFEPVSNGTVYDAPADSAVEAARALLSGGGHAAGDCLYFYAPALSQGLWVNANRTYYTTIGCHRFYL